MKRKREADQTDEQTKKQKLTNQTVYLSVEQLKNLSEKFNEKQFNSTVSKEELFELIKDVIPDEKDLNILEKSLQAMDNDTIDFYEYMGMHIRNKANENNSVDDNRVDEVIENWALTFAFDLFDYDKNGHIDKKELFKALKSMGKSVSESDIDILFQAFDTNGDNVLCKEEFAQFIKLL